MRTFLSLAVVSLAAAPAGAQQDAMPSDTTAVQLSNSNSIVYRNNAVGDLDGDGLVDLFMNRGNGALWMPNAGYYNTGVTVNNAIADLVRIRLGDPLPLPDFGDLPANAPNGSITQSGKKWFLGETYGIATVSPLGVELIELDSAGNIATTSIDSSLTGAHLVTNGDVDGDKRRDILAFEHNGYTTDVHIYLQTSTGWVAGNTFTIPYVVQDATNVNFDGNSGSEVAVAFDGGCAVYLTGHSVGNAGDQSFSRLIPGFTNVQIEPMPGYGTGGQGGVLWSGLINGLTVLAPLSLSIYQPATIFSGISMERLEVGHMNDDTQLDVVFSNSNDDHLYVLLGEPYVANLPLYVWDTSANSQTTKTLQLPGVVPAGSESKPLIQDLNDDGSAEVVFGLDTTDEVVIFEGNYGNVPVTGSYLSPNDWTFSDNGDHHLVNTEDGDASANEHETNYVDVALVWNDQVIDSSLGFEYKVFAAPDAASLVDADGVGGCDGKQVQSHNGVEKLNVAWADDPIAIHGSTYNGHLGTSTSTLGNGYDWGHTEQILFVMVRPVAPNAYGRRPLITLGLLLEEDALWSDLTSRSNFNPDMFLDDPNFAAIQIETDFEDDGSHGGDTPLTGAKRVKRTGFPNITPVAPTDCDNENGIS